MNQRKTTPEVQSLQQNISNKIFQSSRNELSVSMRFLDYAMSKLRFMPDFSVESIQTNGKMIMFHPEFLINQYKTSRALCNRTQLHILLHCIFRHPFNCVHKRPEVWDLASDIAIEYILDDMETKSIDYNKELPKKQSIYNIFSNLKYKNAQSIYYFLIENPAILAEIMDDAHLFKLDEHKIWHRISKSPGEEQKKTDAANEDDNLSDEEDDGENILNPQEPEMHYEFRDEEDEEELPQQAPDEQMIEEFLSQSEREELEKEWQEISEKMELEIESFSREIGEETRELMQNIELANRKKYDYRQFLRKFASLQEENILNPEEFDYIYYTFGLNMYKKMPLIEPLEYRESEKIREFVVAIDTSGSCSTGLIQKFLEYTYSILSSTDVFSSKVNIHIIQCDADVKKDDKVTNAQEMEELLEEFSAFGNGGTDFRPVFRYVDELIAAQEFHNLRGLIYFTDGYGVFPEVPTAKYDTAFVFVSEDGKNIAVPPWAIKIILSQEEILSF